MDFDDDILLGFIEDTREHLGGIEASLMDMEQAGADADPELVNTVFRAAHSIKGGAGFLGLDKVRDLAHKLENVLHLVRSGELVPDHRVVSPLLAGFDLLRTLVDKAQASNEVDISEALASLSELAMGALPEPAREVMAQTVHVPLPGGRPGFTLDRLSLEQGVSGGKYLYLVEYDLIHDVHARGKTPLGVLSAMESSGLILDSITDLAAVGGLEGPLTNQLPFFLLFATIVEPDVVGYLFALERERITQVDHAALLSAARPEAAALPEKPTRYVLEVTGEQTPDELAVLKPLVLRLMDEHDSLDLDFSGVERIGAPLAQFVCAAHRSAVARGKALCVSGVSSERLIGLGFHGATALACGIPACPFQAAEVRP